MTDDEEERRRPQVERLGPSGRPDGTLRIGQARPYGPHDERRGPDGLTGSERDLRDRTLAAEQLERQRVLEQRSAAEVPGFYMRTTIDDVVGKLFALRQRLSSTLTEASGIQQRLDDIEALVEELVEIAIDPDAEPIDAGPGSLMASASRAVGSCSCGQITLETI